MNALQLVGGTDYEESPQLELPIKPEGKGPISHNWLDSYSLYSIILVKSKLAKDVNEPVVLEYIIGHRTKEHTRLIVGETKKAFWVNTAKFCRRFDLAELLASGEEVREQAMKEIAYGGSDLLEPGSMEPNEVLSEDSGVEPTPA